VDIISGLNSKNTAFKKILTNLFISKLDLSVPGYFCLIKLEFDKITCTE